MPSTKDSPTENARAASELCVRCRKDQDSHGLGSECRLFVEPSLTENVLAGADEHDEIARIFVSGWARVVGINQANQERMVSQLASRLRGAHNEGLAAGRARGIEEERKRMTALCNAMADDKERRRGYYGDDAAACDAIADAIAKEGTP